MTWARLTRLEAANKLVDEVTVIGGGGGVTTVHTFCTWVSMCVYSPNWRASRPRVRSTLWCSYLSNVAGNDNSVIISAAIERTSALLLPSLIANNIFNCSSMVNRSSVVINVNMDYLVIVGAFVLVESTYCFYNNELQLSSATSSNNVAAIVTPCDDVKIEGTILCTRSECYLFGHVKYDATITRVMKQLYYIDFSHNCVSVIIVFCTVCFDTDDNK